MAEDKIFKRTLFLLNSIWSAVPALQGEMLGLAQDHHLVLADAKLPEPKNIAAQIKAPVHVVTVASAREHEGWIRAQVEAG